MNYLLAERGSQKIRKYAAFHGLRMGMAHYRTHIAAVNGMERRETATGGVFGDAAHPDRPIATPVLLPPPGHFFP
jgi:hypothetical protein